MPSQACPEPNQLRALTNGTLVDQQSDALFQHVENCSRCLAELQRMEGHSEQSDAVVELLRSGSDIPFDREGQCGLAISKAREVLVKPPSGQDKADSLLTSRIGDYEILRLLGHGGMGSVYLATHQKLARQVAIKVLARHRLFDPQMQARFELEMRAVGALSHANIVTAFDAREIDGTTVLITEYIDGLDLGKVINRVGALSMADACQVALVVAQVLAYTEQCGFVHRDIKPSNIMLSVQGVVKVLDLGLARLDLAGAKSSELTATGQALGSPDYVAPEQIMDSRSVDNRSDIYSLGCTLFKMLSGRNVFEGEPYTTPFAKMTAHVNTPARSLRAAMPSADFKLVELVDSMLHKDPNKRPQSAAEVAQALEPFVSRSNLPALIERALKLPEVTMPSQLAEPQLPPQLVPLVQPQTEASRRSDVPMNLAIAAGLFGILIGLFFGIVITITNPDGSQTKINVPDGSKVQIETGASAATTSTTPPPPNTAPIAQGETEKPPINQATTQRATTGFLADDIKKPLPTLNNVKLLTTNRPGPITVAHVDLPKVEPGEAYISAAQNTPRVSPLLLLDSKTQKVALSVGPQINYGSKTGERSQIFVGQLPAGPFKELFSTERSFALLDHDASTGQSLGVLGDDMLNGDRELVLFAGLPDGNLQEITRQKLPLRREQQTVVSQAKLVARNQAVVILNGVAYGWDLVEGSQLYQTDPNRMFQSKICFSPDRSMMSMVDNSGVHFVNTKTGADLGFVRFESPTPGTAPFDNNSNRIALCSLDAWSTYDLEKMRLTKPQTSTWSLRSWLLGWVGPDMFLGESGVVMHTGRQVPIWKLHSQSLAISQRNSQIAFWSDSMSIVDTSSGVRIRTLVMLPNELKTALADMPSEEEMMLTGPGTKAQLVVELPDPLPEGVDRDELKAKMIEIMKFSEWEPVEESDLKLVVKMAPGKTYKAQYFTYEKVDPNQNIPGNIRPKPEPVDITPMISTLELRKGEELVWFFDSKGAIPSPSNRAMYAGMINGVAPKQPTKEEFIEELQRANPQWFYGIFLPTRIAKPPYTHGLGASRETDSNWVPTAIFE